MNIRPSLFNVDDKVNFVHHGKHQQGKVLRIAAAPDDVTFRYIYTIRSASSWFGHQYHVYEEDIVYINLAELVSL